MKNLIRISILFINLQCFGSDYNHDYRILEAKKLFPSYCFYKAAGQGMHQTEVELRCLQMVEYLQLDPLEILDPLEFMKNKLIADQCLDLDAFNIVRSHLIKQAQLKGNGRLVNFLKKTIAKGNQIRPIDILLGCCLISNISSQVYGSMVPNNTQLKNFNKKS